MLLNMMSCILDYWFPFDPFLYETVDYVQQNSIHGWRIYCWLITQNFQFLASFCLYKHIWGLRLYMMWQLPDSMKHSQADLYLETYQVLDLEMSRLRDIQRWQASAASKVFDLILFLFLLFTITLCQHVNCWK